MDDQEESMECELDDENQQDNEELLVPGSLTDDVPRCIWVRQVFVEQENEVQVNVEGNGNARRAGKLLGRPLTEHLEFEQSGSFEYDIEYSCHQNKLIREV